MNDSKNNSVQLFQWLWENNQRSNVVYKITSEMDQSNQSSIELLRWPREVSLLAKIVRKSH